MERALSSADRNRKGCACQGGEWGLVCREPYDLGQEKSSSHRTRVWLIVGVDLGVTQTDSTWWESWGEEL